MSSDRRGSQECPACGAPWQRTTRFCPRCGVQRSRLEAHAHDQRATTRAVAALALAFVGALACIALPALSETLAEDAFQASVVAALGLTLCAALAALATENSGLVAAFPWRSAPRAWLDAAAVALAGFGVSWGYTSALAQLSDGEGDALEFEYASVAQMWIAVVLLAPIAEELLCRGAVWRALQRLAPGRPIECIVATAALFALLHGLNGGFALEFPHRFVFGLGVGWLRQRSASLAPCIAAHALHNALACLVE